MSFKIVSGPSNIEVIATGKSIRELRRLRKRDGGRRWRKLKGIARIEFADGTIYLAEFHWYESHGVGRKEHKIKRILEEL